MATLICPLAFAGVAGAAGSPVGAHSMLQLNSPLSFMQAMFAEAAGMHASAIRLDVAPTLVFSAPAQPPDFSGLDEVMALSRQYNLPVVADLLTIPSWIANCQTPTAVGSMARCGTDGLSAYGSLLTQIVAHADPVIRDWEVWNEPDTSAFFTGTPQQYAWMLRTAHDAIKAIDPQADVLLGGVSGTGAIPWLAQVFATPGADAAAAFDIANVHERNRLGALAADIVTWKWLLASYGFTGPLWVTEHGYPSDPAFQYDPAYSGGPASQAAYLTASIPTLIDAGASEVFVTERDNLGGQFASEGVLGGDVMDPPVANPLVIEKPAYAAVASLAACYVSLGRDCPGPAPTAAPGSLSIPATRLGSATTAVVSVSDSGPGPVTLGPASLAGPSPDPFVVASDNCSGQIVEPAQSCTLTVRFAPLAGGGAAALLLLPFDNGNLSIPLDGVAPSVSSLASPQLAAPAFTPTGRADGVGHTQRLVLALTNPLGTPVHVARASLAGRAVRRFAIRSDRCANVDLSPGAGCRVSVLFTPTRAGTARIVLGLSGDGTPLSIPLSATAFALPAVALVSSADERGACFPRHSHQGLVVHADQPASVRWRVLRVHHRVGAHCPDTSGLAAPPGTVPNPGRSAATGRTSTGEHFRLGPGGAAYTARIALPVNAGRRGLAPGAYRLTITPSNEHGTGHPETSWLTVSP